MWQNSMTVRDSGTATSFWYVMHIWAQRHWFDSQRRRNSTSRPPLTEQLWVTPRPYPMATMGLLPGLSAELSLTSCWCKGCTQLYFQFYTHGHRNAYFQRRQVSLPNHWIRKSLKRFPLHSGNVLLCQATSYLRTFEALVLWHRTSPNRPSSFRIKRTYSVHKKGIASTSDSTTTGGLYRG
jgi:hypothetical protein